METDTQQLCDDLFVLLARLKAAMANFADAHSLTPPQLYAVHAIADGGATMGQLAAGLHCDASNVTGIVDRLVAQQLITSQESARDRRSKVLALTETGQAIIQKLTSEMPLCLNWSGLSPAERAQFHRLLSKLTA